MAATAVLAQVSRMLGMMPVCENHPEKLCLCTRAGGLFPRSADYCAGMLDAHMSADPPDGARPSRFRAMAAIKTLLAYIGEDVDRPGLLDTPERVLKAWEQDWGKGYRAPPPELRMFPERGIDYDQMVVVRAQHFYSCCEHHMAPFFGTADIAYIPDPARGVLGLSKFSRVLGHFSRRLQVQERLTAQVADYLCEHVSPNVAVVMRAQHMCMMSRGVGQHTAVTKTSAMRGEYLTDAATRAEAFRLFQAD